MLFEKGKKKDFELTPNQIDDYIHTLALMKGKKYVCKAMLKLTCDAIYKRALVTFEQAIKNVEKVIKRGARFYRKDGRTHRLIAAHTAFVSQYEMAVLLVESKMHLLRAESCLEELLSLKERLSI